MHLSLADNIKKLNRFSFKESDKKLVKSPKHPEIKRPKKPVDKATMGKTLRTRVRWWNGLTYNEQKEYLKDHPKSKLPIKKTRGPGDKENKEKDDKKTTKNSKKDQQSKTSSKKKNKKIKPKPITKNKKTTKLFRPNDDEINEVPEKEQQRINKEIEDTIYNSTKEEDDDNGSEEKSNSPEDDEEEENYKKEWRAKRSAALDDSDGDKTDEKEKKVDKEKEKEKNDPEPDTQDLEDKVDKQLHPQQKIKFLNAAKVYYSDKSSDEQKAKALRKLKQLKALVVLTKIAGAATSAALIYYFGSSAGAQCATFFALHHAQHDLANSPTKAFLQRWTRRKLLGDNSRDDDDDNFKKLLGVYEHSKSSHKSSHNSHFGGHSHHKKH